MSKTTSSGRATANDAETNGIASDGHRSAPAPAFNRGGRPRIWTSDAARSKARRQAAKDARANPTGNPQPADSPPRPDTTTPTARSTDRHNTTTPAAQHHAKTARSDTGKTPRKKEEPFKEMIGGYGRIPPDVPHDTKTAHTPTPPAGSESDRIPEQQITRPETLPATRPITRPETQDQDRARPAPIASLRAHAPERDSKGNGSVLDDPRIPAAPQDAYERTCARILAGEPWHIARVAESVTWSSMNKTGLTPANRDHWMAIQDSMKRALALDTASKAHAAGFNGIKTRKRTKVMADGTTETEEITEHHADPAMAKLALEAIDPTTFGRQAAQLAPVTAIQINVSYADRQDASTAAQAPRPAIDTTATPDK